MKQQPCVKTLKQNNNRLFKKSKSFVRKEINEKSCNQSIVNR